MGRQIGILTAGLYRINTDLFNLITSQTATRFQMSEGYLKVYRVQPDRVRIVTTLDGRPIGAVNHERDKRQPAGLVAPKHITTGGRVWQPSPNFLFGAHPGLHYNTPTRNTETPPSEVGKRASLEKRNGSIHACLSLLTLPQAVGGN